MREVPGKAPIPDKQTMDASETQRRTLPPGGTIPTWPAPDGWRLRVAIWPQGTRGTLLFVNGRGDFIEKYAEPLHHWRARGWALVACDWRGQGGSGRWQPGPDAFATYTADLRSIVAQATHTLPHPLVAVGHSMGGHILLRAISAGTPAIARAVLIAPMLALRAQPLLAPLVRTALRLGLAARPAPGQGPRDATAEARRAAILTSDLARQSDEGWWLARHPALASPGATWGWLDAALRSIAMLPHAPRPATPIAAILAAHDRVVDTAKGAALIARMLGPPAILATLPGEHELLREIDSLRAAVHAHTDLFLEQA